MSGWTHHGGRLNAARQAFGEGKLPWLDLSTGINPNPWPHASTVAIDWAALPDEEMLAALEKAAAGYFGVDPAHVCALPGTEMGLRLLHGLLPLNTGAVRHVVPGYRTHGEIFPDSEAVPDTALSTPREGALILANPNNPTGCSLDTEPLREILARQQAGGGWLVLDEAFADADPHLSMAAHVNDAAPLVIFRSFGKFFGLAGVRLGFLIAPRALVTAYRSRLGSWPVSAAALTIGTAAYKDMNWIAATRTSLKDEAAQLDQLLQSHGLSVMGGCPLFRLVEDDRAGTLFNALARQSILTRPFDYRPDWLRIGLPGSIVTRDRLDAALYKALNHG